MEQQEKTEQALSAKESKAMKKEEKRKLKETTLEQAYAKAYEEVKKIDCDCLFYRNDIGKKDMN